MTYNRDNIVGVEFTVKGENPQMTYKITRAFKNNVVLMYGTHQNLANTRVVLKLLNNGTWIVKNSKV